MQLDRLERKLERLERESIKGKRVRDLHRIFNLPEIWYEAYANIYSNKGAMTTGIDDDTLDGMSKERIEEIIRSLRKGTYKSKPVRRVYIPKREGKLRPLGIPSGIDNMVQQVVKIILERIYEPIFLDSSHGFRPNRSCHTALKQVRKVWTGTKWFIKLDIKDFFDTMSHEVMVLLLEKRVDDKRFIKVIREMLKAGYLEDLVYHKSYSGSPQGGIVSPILSNIYLHELDCYVERLIFEFNRGKRRPENPKHRQLTDLKYQLRKKMRQNGSTPELVKRLAEAERYQKEIPHGDLFSGGFKRLRYCRYADDAIFGVIGSKQDAKSIKGRVTQFLNKELKLRVAEEKTTITSGKKGTQFLSYAISTRRTDKTLRMKVKGTHTRRRTVTESISLRVPLEKVIKFNRNNGYGCWETSNPFHRTALINGSDEEIILTYNSEFSGFANYYALAYDVKSKLSKLEYMANYSLFKTLANKHRCKQSTIQKKLKAGKEYIHRFTVSGKPKETKIFRLKHLEKQHANWEKLDKIPNTQVLTSSRSELVRRMEADTCEYCGHVTPDCEVHHVRKLKDLKKKPKLEYWEKVMIYRSRKTLIICRECHDLLHAGKLPDNRYRLEKV